MSMLRPLLTAALTLWLILFGLAAGAQDDLASDAQNESAQLLDPEAKAFYDEWLATAQRAEEAIDADRASIAAFEELRATVVEYRESFSRVGSANADRIARLQTQLDALGPQPENDGTEAEDIAVLRQRLNEQITSLRVPSVIAQEAFSNADGLVRDIDQLIRARQTQSLLERGDMPLSLALWKEALTDIKRANSDVWIEIRAQWDNPVAREQASDNLPLTLALATLALLLLARGRRWAERIGDYLRTLGGSGTGVWDFAVSLGKIILPYAGLLALTASLNATGLVGLRGNLILSAIPQWGAILLVFGWLADRLYPKHDGPALTALPPERRATARFYITSLAVLLVIHHAIYLIGEIEPMSSGARAALGLGPIILAAIVMYQLRRLAFEVDDSPEASRINMIRFGPILRRLVSLVAVLAPVLAIAGYGAAADALIYPTIWTLALFGTVSVLQKFVTDLYGWLSRKPDAAEVSVVPVLAGIVLTLAALPLLALIWGVRTVELAELWDRFLAGVQIGDSRISPVDFLTVLVLFAIGYVVTRLIQGVLRTNLLPKTSLDQGGQNAVVSGVGYIGIILAVVFAVAGAGLDLSSLAIVAGALSVGIGFGLQNIVSNFVSGVILLIERPISEGDWIEVGGQMGYVRNISVRSTRIETFDRTDVIVPNSDLVSGTVTNYTRGNTIGRVIVPVGVAYGTDTKKVEAVLREIAEAHPMVLLNPRPTIAFQGFGADALQFEIRAILRDVNWVLSVRSDLNHEIARRFAEEGFEIPFAQRDIWLRNPEVLPGASGFAGTSRHNFAHEEDLPKKPDTESDEPDDSA